MKPEDASFHDGRGCYGERRGHRVVRRNVDVAGGRASGACSSRKDEIAWENTARRVIDRRVAVEGAGADATIVTWDYEG
jgi:hypothetical protein